MTIRNGAELLVEAMVYKPSWLQSVAIVVSTTMVSSASITCYDAMI